MKKTAKAAVYTGPGRPFEIREYPLTPPPRGMAMLELIASGICGTDLPVSYTHLTLPTIRLV